MGPGAIIAIVLGIVALVSLLCGGLFIAIMLPALGKARTEAQGLRASAQVSTLVQGCILYANDYKDYLPPAATWDAAISNHVPTSGAGSMLDSPQIEGVGNEMIYTPPQSTNPNGLVKVSDIQAPSTWILIREDETRLAPNQKVAVGFADGSVRRMTQQELAALLAAQGAR